MKRRRQEPKSTTPSADETKLGASAPSNALNAQKLGGDGSAMVLGSTSSAEIARDGTAMPTLLGLLDQGLDLTTALNELDDSAVSGDSGAVGSLQFPTLARLGKTDDTPSEGHAVFVANQDYDHSEVWKHLPAALDESRALQGALKATHPAQQSAENAPAAAMRTAFRSGLDAASPGDELVLHYAGHGSPKGLVGVDDDGSETAVVGNEEVSAVARQAVTAGVHARIILDSCYSGSAVERVRDDQIKAVGDAGGSGEASFLLDTVAATRAIKTELAAPLHGWTQVVNAEQGPSGADVKDSVFEELMGSIQLRLDLLSSVSAREKTAATPLGVIDVWAVAMCSESAISILEMAREAVRGGDFSTVPEMLKLARDAEVADIQGRVRELYSVANIEHALAFQDAWAAVEPGARSIAEWLGVDTSTLPFVVSTLTHAQHIVNLLDEVEEAALAKEMGAE